MNDLKRMMAEVQASEQKRLDGLEPRRAENAAASGLPTPSPRRVRLRGQSEGRR